MVQYSYDEGGAMSSYFILTCLGLVLIPTTISLIGSRQKHIDLGGCQCQPCLQNRAQVKKANKRSLMNPQVGTKFAFVALGWAVFAFFAFKVANTEVVSVMWDPYQILRIKPGLELVDIKKHYKDLSKTLHPDKVKLEEGQTKEDAEAFFIEITKAYKALTNDDIRKNWEEFGHPDGKQDFSMGLAIPPWVVAAKNNIWVLMVYGLLFGAGLPYLVGSWWFGSRQRTKDGVENSTAEQFFKAVRDDSGAGEFIAQMAAAWPREGKAVPLPALKSDVGLLRDKIDTAIGSQDWRSKTDEPVAERALVLIYAHLLRIPVKKQQLADEQRRLLLHTPTLLTSLLSMTLSHSWLGPSLTVLHLHALLAQAMMPDAEKLTVFAGVDKATADKAGHDLKELVTVLEKKNSPEVAVVRAAGERWGKLEMAGAAYRVIGEKTVTPSAIMQLVFKLRIAPPLAATTGTPSTVTEDPEEEAAADEAFISGKKDAEDLPAGVQRSGWAHAPYWPANRKPSWWAVLADVRTGKVVVPPMRFTDVPLSDPTRKRNYRTYKMQIQAPPQVGMFPWRLLIFSDTYVGEDVGRDLPLRIEAVSEEAAAEVKEDEISDPDEDTLAGQMAAMRGGKVKARDEDDSDASSDTDGDDAANSSSDSDSD